MTILANCIESPSGPRSSVALRVGGLFAILGGSAFLTLLPLLTRGKFQTFNYLGSVFAAGIILATAFVHILPDAGAFKQTQQSTRLHRRKHKPSALPGQMLPWPTLVWDFPPAILGLMLLLGRLSSCCCLWRTLSSNKCSGRDCLSGVC